MSFSGFYTEAEPIFSMRYLGGNIFQQNNQQKNYRTSYEQFPFDQNLGSNFREVFSGEWNNSFRNFAQKNTFLENKVTMH